MENLDSNEHYFAPLQPRVRKVTQRTQVPDCLIMFFVKTQAKPQQNFKYLNRSWIGFKDFTSPQPRKSTPFNKAV